MDSLEQQTTTSRGMPGFDDGMVNIRELIRIMAKSLVNEIMDAQAEDSCGEGNQRNGFRERDLVASVGAILRRNRRGTCHKSKSTHSSKVIESELLLQRVCQ